MVTLEVEYCTNLPGTQEMRHGQGVIRNFSLSGAYFFSEPPIPLVPGQVVQLNISTSLPQLDLLGTSHIQATGEVVRLEPPESSSYQHGIAVTFLDGPVFSNGPAVEGC